VIVVRDNSKVICAALAKRHTAVGNEWLGMRSVMGHIPNKRVSSRLQ